MAPSDMADPAGAIALADDEDAPLTSARLEQLAVHGTLGTAPSLAPSWRLTPEEVRAVQSIHQDARARNTDRSYATARRYWQAWYRLRYHEDLVLPVAPDAVLRFIIDHVLHWPDPKHPQVEACLLPPWIEAQLVEHRFKRPGPWRVNTIEHRVSVLSSMHDETRDAAGEALPNPCRDPYIVRLLREVRRAHAKHGHVEVRRDAATVNVLQAMLAHCDPETLRGIRDTAVLLVGFNSGGRRRSEIVGLTWERLVADGENFLWKLGQTKTSDGKDVDVQKPIQGKAAQALRAWREASGIRAGYVFREIAKGDRMTERPMSDQAVHRLVQRLAQQADLAGVWGAHSLRAGFITEAGAQGLALQEAMELSDHKTVLVASRYYRTGAASTSPAANLAAGIQLPGTPTGPAQAATRRKTMQQKNPRSSSAPTPGAPPDAGRAAAAKITRIRLHLAVVANSKFVRSRGKAVKAIDELLRDDYGARPGRSINEYELTIEYRDEASLNDKVCELLSEIGEAADHYDCFSDDTAAYEIDGERNW